VNGRGHLDISDEGRHPATAIVDACCALLTDVLSRPLEGVSARVTPVDDQWFAAVSLRGATDVPVRFLAGSSIADAGRTAIIRAIATAVGWEHGALVAAATTWATSPGVRAAVVFEAGDEVFSTGPDADLHRQRALLLVAPDPGRLAVRTESAEYRVLRLAEAGLVIGCSPGANVLEDVDRWCAAVEAFRE
jgi:hypothetical protein